MNNNENSFLARLMFRFPLATVILMGCFLFSGCTAYQYTSIGSTLPHNDRMGYTYENDTVQITYNFSGQNCPVTIEVYNKLSKPIYIDWSKSAVIINNQRYSYWKDEASFHSNSSTYEIQWVKDFSVSGTVTDGTIKRDEQISFIPPQSKVTETRIHLKSTFVAVNKKDAAFDGDNNGKVYAFDKDDSPLKFRSFLTLSVSNDFSEPIYTDDMFWISTILQTASDPAMYPYKPANQYYVSKTTDFGKAAGWVTVMVILGFLGYYGQY